MEDFPLQNNVSQPEILKSTFVRPPVLKAYLIHTKFAGTLVVLNPVSPED